MVDGTLDVIRVSIFGLRSSQISQGSLSTADHLLPDELMRDRRLGFAAEFRAGVPVGSGAFAAERHSHVGRRQAGSFGVAEQ